MTAFTVIMFFLMKIIQSRCHYKLTQRSNNSSSDLYIEVCFLN